MSFNGDSRKGILGGGGSGEEKSSYWSTVFTGRIQDFWAVQRFVNTPRTRFIGVPVTRRDSAGFRTEATVAERTSLVAAGREGAGRNGAASRRCSRKLPHFVAGPERSGSLRCATG